MTSRHPASHFATRDSLGHFEQLATPIWVFDVDNHRMWWANAAGVMFWEASSLENLLCRDFSTDSDIVRTRLHQVVRNGPGQKGIQDTWTLYPNDEPKNVILSFLPITINQGANAVLIEVKQFVDSTVDADSLRILEATRASALMVSTFSAEGQLLAQNPAALACYGPPRPGINGNEMASRLKDPDVAVQLLETANSGKSLDLEQLVWTQDGARVHRIQARRGRDPITGAFATIVSEEDVTKQNALRLQMQALNAQLERKIEDRTRRLDASEERYALATQCAAVWDWDLVQGHLYLSPSFLEALELPPDFETDNFLDNSTDSTVSKILHSEDAASFQAEVTRHLKEPEVPFSHEHRLKTGSGDYRWFHAQGKAIVGADGRATRSVGILTDITERKELEASLLAAHRADAIGQISAGIAHDFNNLLTVILGNAELLDMSDPANSELVAAIKNAALRGADLTRHLLAYSRKQTLRPGPVDLSRLVTSMSKTLLHNLGEAIEVETSIAGGLWSIYADATQVESAVLHLACNARDAMPLGGKLDISCQNHQVIEAQLLPGAGHNLKPGEYVKIQIRDSGEGMTPATLNRACEPFFTTRKIGQGSGLGLSMVFGFAQQSGGGAALYSQPGVGTSACLFLPRSVLQPKASTEPMHAASICGNGESIHLLEDDRAVQSTLRGILESLNYRVTQSSDAATAMHIISQGPLPALILADVVLPGGESGVEFVERLRGHYPQIKAVLMSGYTQEEATLNALTGHGHIFLQKPMNKARLSQMLHAALQGKT
ncbi:response regulator [Pseudophaeobacter sp.]|uniref:response regulator n=1 Tax=Pseudophaeobacter sp. TaxID=1971739 RepID=UPI00329A17D5